MLYHRMNTGRHTKQHKNKEDLIIFMPYTVVYPDTVVILKTVE